MSRFASVVAVLGVLAVAGCAGSGEPPPAPSSSATSTTVSSEQQKAVTAQQVVEAFSAAALPVPQPRDNSRNCASLGCDQLVTTDAITVATFRDGGAAEKYAMTFGAEAHRAGLVVLSYAAARTPARDRPRYEAELAKLLG